MLSRLSSKQFCQLIRPALSQPSVTGVVISTRSKATGDNSQPYVPRDTGFTRDFAADVVNVPPMVPEIEERMIKSLDEAEKLEPIADSFRTWFGKSMPTIHDDKDPARDLVNFPRPVPVRYPEGRRLFLIPDSWFRAMYPKTGVTGPYTLTFGLLTFLLSKEYIIYESELNIGVYMVAIIALGMHKFGGQIDTYLDNVRDTEDWLWYSWQKDAIKRLNEYIELIKKNQSSLDGQDILFDAKRENLALQCEAEYRRRLQQVNLEVRKKLDYLIASDYAKKQFEKNHMVNWILKSVEDAVTKQSEKDVLAKCIGDLKALSMVKRGAI